MPSMKYDLTHCQSEVLSFADHTEELSCRGSNALSQQTPVSSLLKRQHVQSSWHGDTHPAVLRVINVVGLTAESSDAAPGPGRLAVWGKKRLSLWLTATTANKKEGAQIY